MLLSGSRVLVHPLLQLTTLQVVWQTSRQIARRFLLTLQGASVNAQRVQPQQASSRYVAQQRIKDNLRSLSALHCLSFLALVIVVVWCGFPQASPHLRADPLLHGDSGSQRRAHAALRHVQTRRSRWWPQLFSGDGGGGKHGGSCLPPSLTVPACSIPARQQQLSPGLPRGW